MKASELTLGSWVIATNNGVCPLPDKIAKMLPRAGRIVNLGYNFVVLDFVDFGLMLDAIEPMPLTPEILEKNGFIYNEMPFVQGWEQFGLMLYSGGDGYRINCGANVALVVDSVHQLQHALRLCGIEKEVQL